MKNKQDVRKYTERHAATPVEQSTTEFPLPGAPAAEPTMELIPPVEDEVPIKKRRRLFSRRKTKSEPLPIEEVPDEEPEQPDMPPETVSDDTREIPVSSENEALEKTQVIELAEEGGSHLAENEASQMVLEGFAEEADDKPAEPGREETLRRIRQEKIQDFSQRREQHEREIAQAEQEQAEVLPETEDIDEQPAEDNLPIQETLETVSLAEMRQRLQHQVRHSGTTLLLSILLEVILFFTAAVATVSSTVASDPVAYLIVQLVLFGALLAINSVSLQAGLTALFRHHRLTTEGTVVLTSLITLLHTALLLLNTTGVADGSVPVLTGVAGLGLLLVQITHRLELNREVRDLAILSSSAEKLTMKRVTNEVMAEEIGRPAVAMGVPRVAYFCPTEQVEGYADTHEFDPAAGFLRWYLPLSAAMAVGVSVVYLLINGLLTWIFAATLLCGMLVIASPMVLLFSLAVTLFSADARVRKQKTTIADYHAVNVYGNSHAVALDAAELFPENSVMLHGIKTFSGTRIDEAILDAASVSIRAGGPLAQVFRRMILNKVGMLHEVDTLVYEQDMGLSSWISGRRILIGNRKLLDNHGIDIPSKDYEDRYAKNGRQLVYLSIAGELSAMFVVSYIADPAVRRVLKSLTDRRITLLIRTCDQNITESLITSVFDLNGYYVELLNAPAGRSFESLVSDVSQTEPGEIVSAGNALGMLAALAQCRRLRTGVRLLTALQFLVGAVGMVITAAGALTGGSLFPPLYAIEFLAIGSAFSLLLSLAFSKG